MCELKKHLCVPGSRCGVLGTALLRHLPWLLTVCRIKPQPSEQQVDPSLSSPGASCCRSPFLASFPPCPAFAEIALLPSLPPALLQGPDQLHPVCRVLPAVSLLRLPEATPPWPCYLGPRLGRLFRIVIPWKAEAVSTLCVSVLAQRSARMASYTAGK